MKIRVILSLLLILSILLPGCKPEESIQTPVTFFYKNEDTFQGTQNSIILGETREAGDRKDDIAYLLGIYLQGPVSETLLQVFPQGVRLISYQKQNGIGQVTLSDEIAQLQGISLSIACGCLVKTIMSLDDVYGVRIYAETQTLNHNNYIYMDYETILLLDNIEAAQ